MSSALHPPHTSSKQQWWSRPSSAPKLATMPAYRTSDSPSGLSTPTTPTSGTSQVYDDKSLKGSKQSRKFNTLASVIGFRSKKSHPTINIPPGPVSPPLPFQNPPPPPSSSSATSSNDRPPRPPRSARPVTASSSSSYQYVPKSPGERSIYTYPSSEEGGHEPITPSDQLSRHRTSYQPSLFTFAEQQDQGVAAFRLGDPSARSQLLYSPSDTRRISVLSDPSVIDPVMMKRERGIRSSRVSASSYYPAHHQSEQKHLSASGKLSAGYRDSLEKRKSSGDSLYSKEIDVTSDADTRAANRKAAGNEIRPRDQRHSDVPVPAMPKLSASMLLTAQRASLQKSTSEAKTGSPAPAASVTGGGLIRPKAASVSSGSVVSSGRASASIVTSTGLSASGLPLTRNGSVSVTGSAAVSNSTSANSLHQSVSRTRAVPPSRNPPPSAHLPPTPLDRPPSPLTFRSPKNLSDSSLLNSPQSPNDDPSILAFDLPPSTPSSEASSESLSFARSSMLTDLDPNLVSTLPRTHRDLRLNAGRLYRPNSASQTSASFGSHMVKSSFSSAHTLKSALMARGDTPTQRSIRKSMSQSSITAIINGRGDRQRVDPETSGPAWNLNLDEHPVEVLSGMRSLRKQRSMHNTRATGGSLALPPLPQQLRHVSSFNASNEASGSVQSSRTKGVSHTTPPGPRRRGAKESSPGSTATNSSANTPTTPQTHKKRSIFSSHGRDRERDKDKDRRDSNLAHHERDSANMAYSADAHHVEKKKSIGLGLFSGHFSPSSSSSHIPEPTTSTQVYRPASPTAETINTDSISSINVAPPSINSNADVLDQHILPPKELLSQMEALADMDPPSSPPQFSDRGLEDETDEDYWEGSSSLIDQRSMRSRLNSLSGHSIASSADEQGHGGALSILSNMNMNGNETTAKSSSSPSLSSTTRHFANASGSIQGRLESDRPSSSRLPIRTVSGISTRSGASATADSFAMRDGFSCNNMAGSRDSCVPTGLPPPPRRKRAVVSSPPTDQFESDSPPEITNPLSPSPPPRNVTPGRLQRLPSVSSQKGQGHGLQRLSSYETISTYNPNRVSIFRKPSFLNIEDEMNEQINNEEDKNVGGSSSLGNNSNNNNKGLGGKIMATVPEDSFLILEHGKDSFDLSRISGEDDDHDDGAYSAS